MEFWPLFTVASVPVAEIMLVGTLGAFLASGYVNILSDKNAHALQILISIALPRYCLQFLGQLSSLRVSQRQLLWKRSFLGTRQHLHFDIKEREASCSDQDALLSPSSKHFKNQIVPFLSRRKMRSSMSNTWGRFKEITGGTLHQIAEELLTPHAGTMAELFDVGQEECSVIFLWTYLTAALALTIWSTIFMWILT